MSEKMKSEKVGEFAHLMVDIETLGTGSDAVVTQIGAVFFDPVSGCLGGRFECDLHVKGQVDRGRKICPDTLKWYQDNELPIAGLDSEGAIDTYSALSQLSGWVWNVVGCAYEELQVWCKGPDFDFSILRSLGLEVNLELPWVYNKQRDVRSVVALAKASGVDFSDLTAADIKHTALADCFAQVLLVQRAFSLDYCLVRPKLCNESLTGEMLYSALDESHGSCGRSWGELGEENMQAFVGAAMLLNKEGGRG